jgi:hypothetical protein
VNPFRHRPYSPRSASQNPSSEHDANVCQWPFGRFGTIWIGRLSEVNRT